MHRPLSIQLPFDLDTDDDSREICVSGELDIAGVPRLISAMQRLQQFARGDVTLCLDRTTFIDAAGLGAVVSAALMQQAHGDRLRVTRTPSAVRRVFELVGLEQLLDPIDQSVAAGGRRRQGRHVAHLRLVEVDYDNAAGSPSLV